MQSNLFVKDFYKARLSNDVRPTLANHHALKYPNQPIRTQEIDWSKQK